MNIFYLFIGILIGIAALMGLSVFIDKGHLLINLGLIYLSVYLIDKYWD